MIRGAALGAVCVLLVFLVAGGAPQSAARGPVPPSAARPSAPSPGATVAPTPVLAPFYSQKLTWSACGPVDQCTTVIVPQDYAHVRNARIVDLAVDMHPAEDPAHRVGSLVVNPGGPGGSGEGLVYSELDEFTATERADFDIVGFDPRGVGNSDQVACLTHSQLHHDLTVRAPHSDPRTPAQVRDFTQLSTDFGRACAASYNLDFSHASTVETARDLDILRAVLGESHLDYLGLSYGTKIGATYADLFPHRVGRMVLDGAVDLGPSSEQLNLQQAQGFETALRALLRDCIQDRSFPCYFGSTVEAGETRISRFLDHLERHPQRTPTGHLLYAGDVIGDLTGSLYRRGYWDSFSQNLESAMKGNGSAMLASYEGGHVSGHEYDKEESLIAISCTDDPSFDTPAQVEQRLPEFIRAAPVLGRYLAWFDTDCVGWTLRSDEHPATVRAHGPASLAQGAAPIVVIGTTRDPATPYVWAKHLSTELASGRLITRDGDGHTAFNSGNTCVDEAEDAYLAQGTLPVAGLRC